MTALVPYAPPPQIARDLSYAPTARTPAGRLLIRAVENMTGRRALVRRAQGYERTLAGGGDFWREMMRRYGLHLEVLGGSFDDVPTSGPLVMIANHPYGILDGLVMGHILSALRGEFRILAHQVFRGAPDLRQVVLPVDFSETVQGQRANIAMRGQAVDWVSAGGALGIFPGGTVSTAARPFDRPMDPVWRSFMPGWSRALAPPSCRSGSRARTRAFFSWPAICTPICAWRFCCANSGRGWIARCVW